MGIYDAINDRPTVRLEGMHYGLVAVVCLSVCPMSDPKSRPEERRKLIVGSWSHHPRGSQAEILPTNLRDKHRAYSLANVFPGTVATQLG